MLSDIIKQASGWDTKALAKIFSNKEFLKSADGDKEKYLADLISGYAVTLPREIIPDIVTLDALCFTYKKDPSILPILLKYLTHKNLLQEAKDDLDKLNQKLQGVMDEELKKLQDERKLLCEETAELSGKKWMLNRVKCLLKRVKK
ncbi:hypothetical protein [Wolbachia endosymbiont (group A) of Anthophora plumipes]|uniref:hypothetical protein n=1 Tax=Wolbachia endosymbiont (group A) of Anthophora plumipes TaxID=3066194 RepID=UPI0033400A51